MCVKMVESISARFQTHTVAVTFAPITEDPSFSETPNKDAANSRKSMSLPTITLKKDFIRHHILPKEVTT